MTPDEMEEAVRSLLRHPGYQLMRQQMEVDKAGIESHMANAKEVVPLAKLTGAWATLRDLLSWPDRQLAVIERQRAEPLP